MGITNGTSGEKMAKNGFMVEKLTYDELALQVRELAAENARLREINLASTNCEAQGRSFLENLSDIAYTTDLAGTITFINKIAEEITGVPVADIVGNSFLPLFAPESQAPLLEEYQRIARGETDGQIVVKLANGRTCDIKGEPLFDHNGRLCGVFGISRDITKQKEAEERIQQQNEFLSSVIESMPYPFLVVDVQDHSVMLANSHVAPDGAWRGRKCYSLMHHQEKPCTDGHCVCPLEEMKKSGAPVVQEHVHPDGKGNQLNVEVHGYPVFDEQGTLSRMIEYSVDISQRKTLEGEKEQLISELKEALGRVKTLSGFLPICAKCKSIRDDKGYWNQLESYIREHSATIFSHGICPDCAKELYPDMFEIISRGKKP